jgi:dynein heavy chain 1
VKDILN